MPANTTCALGIGRQCSRSQSTCWMLTYSLTPRMKSYSSVHDSLQSIKLVMRAASYKIAIR